MDRANHLLAAAPRASAYRQADGTVSDGERFSRVMTRSLLSRELHELMTSFRFKMVAVLIVGLMTASGFVYSARYQTELNAVRDTRSSLDRTTEQPLVNVVAASHPIVNPPWKLAFLVGGEQSWAPNVYLASLNYQDNSEWIRQDRVNFRLQAGEALDWLFLLRVVLPMAAFLLAYDAICGRRQRSMLKMLLSYPVSRWRLLAAKLGAVWACLAAPFVLGTIGSLLVLMIYGGLRFGAPEIFKILEVLFLGLWSAMLFASLAILVSALTRESAHSLALLALVWITTVVVIPGAGSLLAQRLQSPETNQEIEKRSDRIRDAIYGTSGSGTLRNPLLASLDDFVEERKRAEIQNRVYLEQEALRRNISGNRFSRARLARDLSVASPMVLLQDLAERLIGAGLTRDRRFVEQARTHADDLAAWALEEDLRDEPGPRLLRDVHPARRNDGRHIRFEPDFVSKLPVDLERSPRFDFREQSVADGLAAGAPRIALLALVTAILMAAAGYFFYHYDLGETR